MKEANVAKTIHDICLEHPAVGVLAHTLYEKVSELASRTPNIFISYNLLLDIAKANNERHINIKDHDVFLAIQVLCNPKVGFLRLNYQFIDDRFAPITISISDVIEAADNNVLEHPYTGELIKDYKKFVFPFFTVATFSKEGAC
ncbi:hypothetical protein ACTEV4_001882 [Cronobacter turicensis]